MASIKLGKLAKGKYGGNAQYRMVIDAPQSAVEEKYFSLLRFLQDEEPFGRGYSTYGDILKTKDIYTAGETSSYWGSIETRRGAQIDKFQQIMANVGQMLKAAFQLLRELRILEERLTFYDDSDKGDEAALISLKSVWVDQVEGGAQNASSVLGLATQVGFAALPDLFFSVNPKTSKAVNGAVETARKRYGVNKKIEEVLKRKLKQFFVWKEKTEDELRVGERFKLDYLRQHYAVIRLYLNWLRPYLRNIKRLEMKENHDEADIVAAFETSKVEIEFLAVKRTYERDTPRGKVVSDFKKTFPCVRVQIDFVAIPQMAFQDEYNRGPIHRGRADIRVEGLMVTEEDLKKYERDLEKEDLELLEFVDASIGAMKKDFDHFLKKANTGKDEKLPGAFEYLKTEEKEDEKERPPLFEPFIALGDFAKEMTGITFQRKKKDDDPSEAGAAGGIASLDAYLLYYVFKKQHGMVTE